jgi:hypothetical protein
MLRVSIVIFVSVTAPAIGEAQPASSSPSPSTAPSVTATGAATDASWSIGVAPRIGVVLPTSKLGPMVAGGVELDVALPFANHQLVLAFDATLTRPSHDGSIMDIRVPGGSASYTVHQLEVVIGAMATYRFMPAGHSIVPWLGAGPIVHLLSTRETTSLSPDANTATATELGAELAAGVDIHAGPGFVIGEARVVYSKLDNVLTGGSNAGNLVVAMGYRLVF